MKNYEKLVIGIGGRGCNFIKKAYVDSFVNTYVKLAMVNDGFCNFQPIPVKIKKILIDKSLKRNNIEELKNLFKYAKVSYFVAGLGGNVGSKVTPKIMKIAKQYNNIVVAFVTLPFMFEGKKRENAAIKSLKQIEGRADFVIKFFNQEYFSKASPFSKMKDLFIKQDNKIIEFIEREII